MPVWVNCAIISSHTGSGTHDPPFSGLRFMSPGTRLAQHHRDLEQIEGFRACVVFFFFFSSSEFQTRHSAGLSTIKSISEVTCFQRPVLSLNSSFKTWQSPSVAFLSMSGPAGGNISGLRWCVCVLKSSPLVFDRPPGEPEWFERQLLAL